MGWSVIKRLGEGSYGSVDLARSSPPVSDDDVSSCLNLPPLFAVKSAQFVKSVPLQYEREMFETLQDCPNIIRCYGADASDDEEGRVMYNLFLEYAAGGDLFDRIYSDSSWRSDEQEIRAYTRSILQGLKHIHAKGMIHCDIKPENILLVADEDATAGYTAKIADLGLILKGELSDEADKMRGTVCNLAPETVLYGHYGCEVDIWALGCTLFEMLVGQRLRSIDPYIIDWELVEEMAQQQVQIPSGISGDARDFLSKCFREEPVLRWTANELLGHPFVREASLDRDELSEVPVKCLKRHREEVDLLSNFGKRPKVT